jgi:CO/xanthine dehydrogenase FAD-binding subunit
MPTEKVYCPESLEAALDLVSQYGSDLLAIAGGTMVMSLINDGIIEPKAIMSLHRAGMSAVRAVNGHLEIGATTTLSRVAEIAELPLLAEAARQVGGWAIRNMASLAGNLFVPPPAGDAAVALLALDAEVIAARRGATRRIPVDQFFTGIMQTQLAPDELVARLDVPRPRGQTAFLKFGRRQANTPSVVSVAVRVVRDAAGTCTDARLALGAAGPTPLRARQAESALIGRRLDADAIAAAAAAAKQEVEPFSDALASDGYRRKMVGVFVRRALETIGG